MRPATPTLHFCPVHPMGMVRQIDDAALADRLIKTGPATTALEFGIAAEQRIATNGTIIGPDLLTFLERARPGPLGPPHPGNGIYIARKDLLPLIIRKGYIAVITMGIDRII